MSCNRRVTGSSPCYICLSRCVLGQDTLPSLPADGGQRARWCRCMAASVSLPQGSCGYSVAHHCQCVNGWMTECSVKRFGVSGNLMKRCTSRGHLPFTMYSLSMP
ncbi:hypothetical protein XENOCAPTIV_024493 [Xenoophorus captivus]|uniref:Uncharacterized protein n=1 Tax=Xenoophorus captivus TaxID=1517983 RepID=A0ABV0QJX4_9TELE